MKQCIINPPIDREDAVMDERITKLIDNAIERLKIKGVPIARYDLERKKPYFEYPDGRRVYDE